MGEPLLFFCQALIPPAFFPRAQEHAVNAGNVFPIQIDLLDGPFRIELSIRLQKMTKDEQANG
jgi:hypothetical protein